MKVRGVGHGPATVLTTLQMRQSSSPSSRESHVSYWVCPSPVGRLLLVGDLHGLQVLQFQDGSHPLGIHPGWTKDRRVFQDVIVQLEQYFAGHLKEFEVKLDLQGTPFQRKVWQALRRIPFGRTASYGEIAKIVGHPRAARAVGAANGQNPVSIIVPCHRVIGANGRLVGYGGGLSIKKVLLELEKRWTVVGENSLPM